MEFPLSTLNNMNTHMFTYIHTCKHICVNHIPCGDFAWHLWTGILSQQHGNYTWINITEVQLLGMLWWPVPFGEVPCMVVTNLDLGNAETPKLIWIGSIEKKVSFLFNQNARPVSQDDHTKMITPGMLVPSMASFLVKIGRVALHITPPWW